MKRTVLFAVLCLTLAPGMVWASSIQGTTNPNAFTQDFIDWCQFDCTLAGFRGHFSSPWVSNGGATGTIGLNNGAQFYSNKQGPPPLGVNWVGNFPPGMGVIYNGYQINFQQTGIRITFGSAVEGVGAYIQVADFGPFSATITLFDQSNNPLGSFTAAGASTFSLNGTALFIGAFGVGPISAAQFDATDSVGIEDFAIGTVKSGPFIPPPPIPEPSSLLLFASSALGVAGVIRRRCRGVL